MSRRRDPIPLQRALAELTDAIQPAGTLAEVQREWATAVGETIAGWSRPVAERAGIVTVECDGSVIAHEMEMIKPELLVKLNAALGDAAPRDLRFRTA